MKRLILAFASACLLAAAPPLTPAWILGPEGRAAFELPRAQWLADGGLLLQAPRAGDAPRAWLRLDPATGERKPVLEPGRLLDALQAATAAPVRPASLPWPLALDAAGRRALVKSGGRFVVVDLAAGTARALPRADAAALSPDGARAAYAADGNLHVLDLASGADRALTVDGGGTVLNGTFSWVYGEELFGRTDAAFWWSPDSRRVAFLRFDDAPVPVHSFTDFRPWQARTLTQRYPQPGQPNPLVRVGIAAVDGPVVWAALPRDGWEYVGRLTWTPAGDALAVQVLDRPQRNLQLLLADPATGAAQPVLRERADTWLYVYEPIFIRGGREFLWPSDRSGFHHLYRYDREGRLLNAVTRGDWSLCPWGGAAGLASAVAAVDEREGWAYVTCRAAGILQTQLYRARLDGTAFERVSREAGTHAVTFSPDRRWYVDAHSSAAVPPSLSLRRVDGGAPRILAAPADPLGLATPELATYPAPGGLALPITLLKPRSFDPHKRYPVIFSVYGGPSAPQAADAWGRNLLLDNLLTDAGYIVAVPENRSSAALGMKYEGAIAGRLLGPVETADLEAAVAWVTAQPWADPARLGVWGWSGGGTSTLAALTRTRAFKAGAAVAPVTDWRYYDTLYTEKVMGLPADNPEGYRATSLVDAARNLHGRLLLVHGTHDDNVHPQNAQAFADALIGRGLLFEQMVYPMRDHGMGDVPALVHVYATLLDFWKRNL